MGYELLCKHCLSCLRANLLLLAHGKSQVLHLSCPARILLTHLASQAQLQCLNAVFQLSQSQALFALYAHLIHASNAYTHQSPKHEVPLFTSFVDTKVFLEVNLFSFKTHESAVSFIHIEQLFTKETWLASSSSWQDFNSTVSFVSRTCRQNGIYNLLTMIFNLSFKFFSFLLSNGNYLFILLFTHNDVAIFHFFEHGLEILKEFDFLRQFLHLLPDLRKFLHIDRLLFRVDAWDVHKLFV